MIAFNAVPLNCYSSLHQKLFFNIPWLSMAFNFNLQIPIQYPRAQLCFHLRDASVERPVDVDFSLSNITRWRMDITSFKCFDDYLATLKSNYKKNYLNTRKAFENHGATLSIIDDWSEHAETVFNLYRNVAKRRKSQLYDLAFFRHIAKIPAYKLIAVWHKNTMVSMLIIFDEAPVYHSMVVGFDYDHSRKIFAYSLIHYELIRHAIATQKHQTIDIGITANKAKSMMNFKPVSVCMDISSKNAIIKWLLRLADWLYSHRRLG